jgi:hypothetical protein
MAVMTTPLAAGHAQGRDRRNDDALAGRWGLPLAMALAELFGGAGDDERRALLNALDDGKLFAFGRGGGRDGWRPVLADALADPFLFSPVPGPNLAGMKVRQSGRTLAGIRVRLPEWRDGIPLSCAPLAYADAAMIAQWHTLGGNDGSDTADGERWRQTARADLLRRLGPLGDLEGGGFDSARITSGRQRVPPERWPLVGLGLLHVEWDRESLAGVGADAERLWSVTVRPRAGELAAPNAKARRGGERWTPERFEAECRRLAEASPALRTHTRDDLRAMAQGHGIKEPDTRRAFDVAFAGFPEWEKTGRRRKL